MQIEKVELVLKFTEMMLGTAPKNKGIYDQYILEKLREAHKKGKISSADLKKREISEIESIEEMEEKNITGFRKDEHGIFLLDYMFRGFFKAAAKADKDQIDIKQTTSKIDNFLFVFPRVVYLKRNGNIIKKSDGLLERTGRVQTPQGPRTALLSSEKVDAGCTAEIEIQLIKNREISMNVVMEWLEYGKLCGIGQWRNASHGRFEFMVKKSKGGSKK